MPATTWAARAWAEAWGWWSACSPHPCSPRSSWAGVGRLVGKFANIRVDSGLETGMGELKTALAEAAGKFNPNRTVLPIPDRNFGGTMGRSIDRSVPDWSMVPGPKVAR